MGNNRRGNRGRSRGGGGQWNENSNSSFGGDGRSTQGPGNTYSSFGSSSKSGSVTFGRPQSSTPVFGGPSSNSSIFGSGGTNTSNNWSGGNTHGGRRNDNRKPCKFFAQGRCNYGKNCRFSHDVGTHTSGSNRATTGKPSDSPEALADTIKTDLLQAKPIWPFSCYAPVHQAANLFEGDICPEEVRWDAYLKLQQGGSLAGHNDMIGRQAAELQRKKDEIINQMNSDYGRKQVYEQQMASSNSESSSGASGFGGASNLTSASPFGAQHASSNVVFGAPSSAFQSAQNSSITSALAPSSSALGHPSSTSQLLPPFGNSSASTSSSASSATIFGKSAGGGTFGQSSPTGGGVSPVFGQSSSTIFGQSSSPSPFGSSSASASGALPGASSFSSGPTPPFGATPAPAFGQNSGGINAAPAAGVAGAFPAGAGAGASQVAQVSNLSFGAVGQSSFATTPVNTITSQNSLSMGGGSQPSQSAWGSFSSSSSESKQVPPFGNSLSPNTPSITPGRTFFSQSTPTTSSTSVYFSAAATVQPFGTHAGSNAATISSDANSAITEDQSEEPVLSEEEEAIRAFQATSFTYGRVPETAPPPQFCT